jgi:hypothetical protein
VWHRTIWQKWPHRSALLNAARSQACASQFADLFNDLMGHAFALLCSIRNEGYHWDIKLKTRTTPRIGAPLIAARKRRRQMLEHMAKDTALRDQFCRTIRRREVGANSINAVLEHRMARYYLMRMPLYLEAEHLYESRMDDRARDTTGPRVELQRFVAATPRPQACLVTTTEQLCISFPDGCSLNLVCL